MDDDTVLNLIAFGAALNGGQQVFDRLSGSTMPPVMKRAYREIKANRKAGADVIRWLSTMRVDVSDGVLEGVLRRLEGKEERHAEILAQYRAAFERTLG